MALAILISTERVRNSEGLQGLIVAAADTVNSSLTSTIDIPAGGSFNITNTGTLGDLAGTISGAGEIIKAGAGTVTISGVNTYDGNTTINLGRLNVTNANALGSTVGRTIINGNPLAASPANFVGPELAISGNLIITGETVELNSVDAGGGIVQRVRLTSDGDNIWDGPIIAQGTAQDQINVASGVLQITGPISTPGVYSGQFMIRGAATAQGMILGDLDFNGTGTVRVADAGVTWTIGAPGKTYSWADTIVGNGNLVMDAPNVLPPASTLTMGDTAVPTTSGTLKLNGYDQTVATLFVPINVTASQKIVGASPTLSILTINNSTAQTYNKNFGGTGTDEDNIGITLNGGVNMTFSGANTYSGPTTINNGTLNTTGTTAIGNNSCG